MEEENKKINEAKPKVKTLVSRIKLHMEKGVESKKACASLVLEECKQDRKTTTRSGKELTEGRVLSHVTNIENDIKKSRKGWWSTYTVEASENSVKWVLKA